MNERGCKMISSEIFIEWRALVKSDPKFSLTLEEFAILREAKNKLEKATSNDKDHVLEK